MSTEKKSAGKPSVVQAIVRRETKDLKSLDLWRAVAAEFVGTLVLCTWTIGSSLYQEGVSAPPSRVALALTAGLCVASIITMLETVSGGHINPTISIGFVVTGKISIVRFVCYGIAQTTAGLLAPLIVQGLTFKELHGSLGLIAPGPGIAPAQAFFCELLLGFFLLFGTFAIYDPDRTNVRGTIPLFVGLIVITNVLFGFSISGGCMNPARNFGPAVLTGNTENQWVYWFGPLIGGALGALLYDKVFSVKASLLQARRCGGGSRGKGIVQMEEQQTMIQDKD